MPTPATKMSIVPSVSRQSSSAVVVAWISGLAGFSNCCGMTAPGISSSSSSALRIAPFIPSEAGVRMSSAPSSLRTLRRSSETLSGIAITHLYPLAAATMASAMPVLPEVGSTITDLPGLNLPARSIASTIATPMRSLTECAGLKNSSFAATVATHPEVTRLSRTSGVLPTSLVMSAAMRIVPP